MGMSASADVVYGVDLGDREYGESYVEYPDEGAWEDGLSEALDDLIGQYQKEVLGQPEVDWRAPGEERDRQLALLRKWQQDFPQYSRLGYASSRYTAIAQESYTARPPSTSTGTVFEPLKAITSFSVKRQGIVSNDRPLCLSAIFTRQQ